MRLPNAIIGFGLALLGGTHTEAADVQNSASLVDACALVAESEKGSWHFILPGVARASFAQDGHWMISLQIPTTDYAEPASFDCEFESAVHARLVGLSFTPGCDCISAEYDADALAAFNALIAKRQP